MSENKQMLLEIQMWVEDEEHLKMKYTLPHVTDETMVEFYKMFFHKLCQEISKVPGSENLFGLLLEATGETEEKADDRLE